MKIKNLGLSLGLYGVRLLIVIMRISLGTFDVLGLALIMIFVALVIKDVLLYGVDLKPLKIRTYKRPSHESSWYRYALSNRIYVFPTILTIYLLYLLIKQTHLWNLQNSIVYSLIEENILLGVVIISGIATLFGEEKDKRYEHIRESWTHTYLYVGLSIFLSLLAVYIVYLQVASLGWISYIISSIAGILIFLIGMMIILEEDTVLDEEGEKKDTAI